MKKIIATVLATVMILSILATIAIVPTAAASTDGGDWAVYAAAKTYKDENGEIIYEYDDPSKSITNIAGYEYTDDGFHVSAECSKNTATTQRFNIMTKTKQNLKRGVTMTVEVEDFTAVGDWWFSFCIWDSPNLDHGAAGGTYGNGYLNLIRMTVLQNYICDSAFYDWTKTMSNPGTPTNPCKWNMMDKAMTAGHPYNNVRNDNGVYELTFDLQYDSATDYYTLYVCDIQVTPADVFNNYMHERFADGFGYIGFAVSGSATDCTSSCTITEYNGEVPAGTDASEQIYNVEPVGPMIDTATLDPEAPVLLFDSLNENGEYQKTGEFSTITNMEAVAKYDGSFTIYPKIAGDYAFFAMTPKSDYSYEASDYPYVAILLRGFCTCTQIAGEEYMCMGVDTHSIDVWYCADTIFQADNSYWMAGVTAEPETYTDSYGNEYQLFLLDFSSLKAWTGRINSFRVDYIYNDFMLNDPELNNFDFCYMGYFQTEDAATAYAENYADSYVQCAHEDTTVTPEVPAKCDETGKKETEQCNTCGEYLKAPENIPALGHAYEASDYVAPTCEGYGREAGETCTRCGTSSAFPIDPIGHLTNVYSSTDEGHYQACQREDCDYTTAIEEHTIGDNDVCTVCGHGCPHAETTWTVSQEATCTVPGAKVETCNECGAAVGSEEIPALGHTEEVLPAVAATCTEAGRTEGKICSVCDTVTVTQTTIPALGHTEEVVPGTEATCTETGLTDGKVCTVCGETTVEQTETAVTEHTYDDDKDTTCNVCGATRTIPTQAPTTTPTESNGNDNGGDDGDDEGGCGSVIGLGAFAVIATVGLAGVVCFKKKED